MRHALVVVGMPLGLAAAAVAQEARIPLPVLINFDLIKSELGVPGVSIDVTLSAPGGAFGPGGER